MFEVKKQEEKDKYKNVERIHINLDKTETIFINEKKEIIDLLIEIRDLLKK